jgi:hypothetical protein
LVSMSMREKARGLARSRISASLTGVPEKSKARTAAFER